MKQKRELSKEEIIEKMKQLGGVSKAPINENVSKHSTLLYYKGAADGRIYGIIKESSNYYIKVASGSKTTPNITDFTYIGNTNNKLDEQFNGYPEALKRLNLKMKSLNEAFSPKGNVEEEEIPLNTDIDTKVEPTADVETEPKSVEEPSAEPEVSVNVENTPAPEETTTDGVTPEVDNTESEPTTEEPAPEGDESSKDGGDTLTNEIQSLLGKLNQSYQEKGDNITPQESKAAINSMISSTKVGLKKMTDDEKQSLIKRIEDNGKKIDEDKSSDGGFTIMGKYKNGESEELDTAKSKEEADFLTKEYKMAHGKDWRIWVEPAKTVVAETEDVLNEDKEKTPSKNKKYSVSFVGKKTGSIGKERPFKISVEGKNEDAVESKLYDDYDHISKLVIKETNPATKQAKIAVIQENIKRLINESVEEFEEKKVEEAFDSLSEEELQSMINEIDSEGDEDNWINEINSKLESIQEDSEKMANEYCTEKYGSSLNEIDLKSIFDKATSVFNKKSAEKLINSDSKLKTNYEDGIKAIKAAEAGDTKPYIYWKQKVGKSLAIFMLLMKLTAFSSPVIAADVNSVTPQDVNNVKNKIELVTQAQPDAITNVADSSATKAPLKATVTNDELTVDVDSQFESGQTDLSAQQEAEIEAYLTKTLVKYIQSEVQKSPTKQVKVTVEGSASNVTAPAGKTNKQLAEERTAVLDRIVTKVLSDAMSRGDIKTADFELIPGTAVVAGPSYTKGTDNPNDQKYKDFQYSRVKAVSAGADYKPVKLNINIGVNDPNAEWSTDRVNNMFTKLQTNNQLPKNITFNDFVQNIKNGNISIKNQTNGQILNSNILKNIK